MRVSTSNAVTTIDQDEIVVALSAGVDLEAATWTYPDGTTLDIRGMRPNLGALSSLYLKAESSKQPIDAAAYVKHKARIIASFNKRDQTGARYE
ncbi:hypothetical protein [Paenibacillus qinlingensis]|uniref:hypothetical protein n=1 Tax=Paenibacillus qinlingensis TaxID=1837343 RepID=UPI0015663375|nr:hypothetical protein [Paenibacillus qinlingensis]NQX61817.1 hypothetical protein [Paenibacillus qinlingensis]